MSFEVHTSARLDMPLKNARFEVTVQMTRDGELTGNLKTCVMLDLNRQVVAVFWADSQVVNVFDGESVGGVWLFLATDTVLPRRAATKFVEVVGDTLIPMDLNDGSGGGSPGLPAIAQAIVRVDAEPAAREVVAVERQVDGGWRVAGMGVTDELGNAALDLRVTSGARVYAFAIDDWGTQFAGLMSVEPGRVIRPTQFRGWLYRITQAGQLPATEPEWWPIEGDNAPRELGTARAVAVRYYRPLAHGPVPVEMI